MKTFQLEGSIREGSGKKAAKAIRKEGKIPCVIYGGKSNGEKNIQFTVTNEAVRGLIYTPEIFSVNLTLDGKTYQAIIKDLQFQPVTDAVMHIDFLEVDTVKPVVMEVPVVLEGHAEGVKAGGKLSLEMRKLKVRAIYTEIPEKLVINIDKLGLGKTMQVGAIHFDGLEITNAKNAVVCAVKLTRAARGAAATQE